MATRLIQTALGPRMAVIEEKLDRLVAANFTGGASAPPSPPVPASVTDETVTLAEEALADPNAVDALPSGSRIAVGSTESGPRANAVPSFYPLQAMTVREALEARLIDWRGRLNRARYEAAVAALADRDDALRAVTLPIDKGAIPDNRPPRWSLGAGPCWRKDRRTAIDREVDRPQRSSSRSPTALTSLTRSPTRSRRVPGAVSARP
jgi:hypothetical protein